MPLHTNPWKKIIDLSLEKDPKKFYGMKEFIRWLDDRNHTDRVC